MDFMSSSDASCPVGFLSFFIFSFSCNGCNGLFPDLPAVGATGDADHVELKQRLALKNKLLRSRQLAGQLKASVTDSKTDDINSSSSSEHTMDPMLSADSALPLSVIPHGAPLDRNFPSSFHMSGPSSPPPAASFILAAEDDRARSPTRRMINSPPAADGQSVPAVANQTDSAIQVSKAGHTSTGAVNNVVEDSSEEASFPSSEDEGSAEDEGSVEVGPASLPTMMMMMPELRPIPREQLLSIPESVRRSILHPLDREADPAAHHTPEEAVKAEVTVEDEEEER